MSYSDFSIESLKRDFDLTLIEDRPIFSAIFGVVTTGSLWRFLKLAGNEAFVDTTEYPIQKLDQIFGILQTIAVGE